MNVADIILMSNGVKRHHDRIYDFYTRQEIKRYADTLTLCESLDIVGPTNHAIANSKAQNLEWMAM